MWKKLLLTLLTIGAVGASLGAYYKWRNTEADVQVVTAPVIRGDIVAIVGATGTLDAVTTVQVGTQVSGTVKELNADFNSMVHKGQVIARLDPSLFETQIEQARANLVRAQADLERLKVSLEDARTQLKRSEELAGRNLIPRSELEAKQVALKATEAQIRSSQAQVTQAEASLNQNRVNLEHTVISAPIDGIVIARNVDVGQTVAASLQSPTLFLLAADLTKMKVTASIDESEIGRIRTAQPVRFRVDAYPTEEFLGSVLQVRLQPVVTQNVVTYSTVIEVPNPDYKLKPGMTANVAIEVARRENVLKIPNSATRFRPTTEIFAALHQTPPADFTGGGGRRGGEFRDGGDRGGGSGGGRGNQGGGGGRPTGTSGIADDQQPAQGQSGRQGGGRGDDPERRKQFMERLEKMSPEGREAFLKRMREAGDKGGGRKQAERPAAPKPNPGNAATLDSLFGPLPTVETPGRLWVYNSNKQLDMIHVRLGISDNTHTELVSGEVKEGTPLVTSITTAADNAAAASGRSPLMPQRGFGGPGGGGRGPGGGGGGRGR